MDDHVESSGPDRDSTYSKVIEPKAIISPAEFTLEYDRQIDELEEALWKEAFEALQGLDIDTAASKLSQVIIIREEYLQLVDNSARDVHHPLSLRLPELRRFGVSMDALARSFQTVLEAFLEYRRGQVSNALRLLNFVESGQNKEDADELVPVLSLQVDIASAQLTGAIRQGVLDYAGARAAYDRGAAAARSMITKLSDVLDEGENLAADQIQGISLMMAGAQSQRTNSEGLSFSMQYEQLMASSDYVSAAEAALAASRAFDETADIIRAQIPLLGSFQKARAFEALAQASIAEASLMLERGEWTAASEKINTVRDHYEAASRVCLEIKHPIASMLQERYLNSGFTWMIRFRRQLERERALTARIEQLQTEIRDFQASIRSALSPSGVVVNNATEMVTSVQQQVEVNNRIEANIRSILREFPKALDDAGLPDATKTTLGSEAIQLAEDASSGTDFFTRVRSFAQKVASVAVKGAEVAAPILELLRALSVVK